MARYTWYEEVTTRKVYAVPLPCMKEDVGQMWDAIVADIERNEEDASKWGSAFEVTSDGETLRFSYIKREEKKKP